MPNHFSQATIDIMSEARNIAINLGYEYISTIHIFLADCNSNSNQSIKDFVFKSEQDLLNFYNSQKIGDTTIFLDSLAITIEAEKTITKAVRLMKTVYKDKQVYPHHLFLAASQLKETTFYSALQPKEELFERLERYYIRKGLINKNTVGNSFWQRFLNK